MLLLLNAPFMYTELDGQEEMSSSVLIIAGATVTIVSVGILAIILTALSCTVICKKRQLEVPELDLQGQAGKRDEGYQSESFTSEVYVQYIILLVRCQVSVVKILSMVL